MTTSKADNERFQELEALVTDAGNKKELKELETATDILDWGANRGVDTLDRSDLGKYTHKLKLIGLDVKTMWAEEKSERQEAKLTKLDEIAGEIPRVDLWTAAVEAGDEHKALPARFAVVDATGEALWYGDFHPEDRVRVPGDPDTAEQSVAEKGIFLASLAHQAVELDGVRLRLHTQHPELDTDRLRNEGVYKDGMVAVDVVVDEDDRAEVMCGLGGYRALKHVDLATVIDANEDTDDEPGDDAE